MLREERKREQMEYIEIYFLYTQIDENTNARKQTAEILEKLANKIQITYMYMHVYKSAFFTVYQRKAEKESGGGEIVVVIGIEASKHPKRKKLKIQRGS